MYYCSVNYDVILALLLLIILVSLILSRHNGNEFEDNDSFTHKQKTKLAKSTVKVFSPNCSSY